MRSMSVHDLDALGRLGWVGAASPVTSLPKLAQAHGLAWLGVKRDDLIEPLHGGTKVRKLDHLLAAPPYADASAWAGVGAIGSGNLVALTAAASALGRRLAAHIFWTPISASTLDNLAFVASGPSDLSYYRSSTTMTLRHPALVLGAELGALPVVPPGASAPLGVVGLVRAGLELAEQIRQGELPEPDRIYVAFGSGGTAVGLALGLLLAGLRTEVVGVRVVARAFAGAGRIRGLQRGTTLALASAGLDASALASSPLPLRLDHAYAGRGYAIVTAESLAACATLREDGIELEPVYTGKAMAALFGDARASRMKTALFWQTARREPLLHATDWRERLPPALARRLHAHEQRGEPIRPSRRRVVVALGAVAAATALGVRITGYRSVEGLMVLASWQAEVLRAAADALIVPAPDEATLTDLAARIDRYLAPMPQSVLTDVHALIGLIEHGTLPLGGHLHRFTALDRTEREAYLSGLAARGGLLAQAYGALRDLCMLGYYQRSATWTALGYEGPRLPLSYDPRGPERIPWPDYEKLRAPEGALPASVLA
jgi:D-cysteine desulfhydrase